MGLYIHPVPLPLIEEVERDFGDGLLLKLESISKFPQECSLKAVSIPSVFVSSAGMIIVTFRKECCTGRVETEEFILRYCPEHEEWIELFAVRDCTHEPRLWLGCFPIN